MATLDQLLRHDPVYQAAKAEFHRKAQVLREEIQRTAEAAKAAIRKESTDGHAHK